MCSSRKSFLFWILIVVVAMLVVYMLVYENEHVSKLVSFNMFKTNKFTRHSEEQKINLTKKNDLSPRQRFNQTHLRELKKIIHKNNESSPKLVRLQKQNNNSLNINQKTWVIPTVLDYIQNKQQDDVVVADHIRRHWLLPPFSGPRNLSNPNRIHYSQRGQSEFIDNILNHKTGGFYIESGAADGEALSNSLFFEKSRNWTGLLVEANSRYFDSILQKRRHTYMMNACLSPKKTPSVLDFRMAGFIGGLTGFMENAHQARIIRENGEQAAVKIQCFPILSILRAMNVTHVDYFSLDIEGAELDVLQTIPFEEIKIDVLSVEYKIGGDYKGSQEKLANIKKLLVDKYGYKVIKLDSSEDVILRKK